MTDQEMARLRELRYKEDLTKEENEELNELSLKEAEAIKADPNHPLSNNVR